MSRLPGDDIVTRMDERFDAWERDEQEWQRTLASDPCYLEWLAVLECQKQHAAAQAFEDELT